MRRDVRSNAQLEWRAIHAAIFQFVWTQERENFEIIVKESLKTKLRDLFY